MPSKDDTRPCGSPEISRGPYVPCRGSRDLEVCVTVSGGVVACDLHVTASEKRQESEKD